MTHRYKPELNVTPGNSILYVTAINFFPWHVHVMFIVKPPTFAGKKTKTINAWLLERVSDRV